MIAGKLISLFLYRENSSAQEASKMAIQLDHACRKIILLAVIATVSILAVGQTGFTAVQSDDLTFKLLSGQARMVEKDGKLLATIQGGNLLFMPAANLDADAKAHVQVEFEKFIASHPEAKTSHAAGPPQGAAAVASPGSADNVKWNSGDPTVHLTDGWVIEFSGGNGSNIHVTDPHGYVVSMHFKPGARGVGEAIKGAGTSIATMGTDASFEGGAWVGTSQGGKNFSQDEGLMGVKTHTPILVVQAAGEVLKAQQVVVANGAGHQYTFVGASNMDRLSKRQ
jgi:hypothetical protein